MITNPGKASCCTCFPSCLLTIFVGGNPKESNWKIIRSRSRSSGYSAYKSICSISIVWGLWLLISAKMLSVAFSSRLNPPGRPSPPKYNWMRKGASKDARDWTVDSLNVNFLSSLISQRARRNGLATSSAMPNPSHKIHRFLFMFSFQTRKAFLAECFSLFHTTKYQ